MILLNDGPEIRSKSPFPGRVLNAMAAALIFGVVVVLSVLGKLDGLNNFIDEQIFSAIQREIDSDAVIVAIDTKSLQAEPNWPWQRDYHARLVDRLNEAGAKAIAFDVDFSAPRNAAKDAVFAGAIERSDARIVLGAFRQPLSPDLPHVVAEITPIPALARVANLGVVNYPIDDDGVVRNADASSAFSSGQVPSFSYAALGEKADMARYGINFAISPKSFPTYSYTDVIEGRTPAAAFKDKIVFVGATAIELGDEYVIPVSGVVSGITVNALAYETVRLGHQIRSSNLLWILGFSLLITAILMSSSIRRNAALYLATQTLVTACIGITSFVALTFFFTKTSIAALVLTQLLCAIFWIGRELEKRSSIAFKARMASLQKNMLINTLITDNHEGFIVTNGANVIEMCNDRAMRLMAWQENPVDKSLADVAPMLLPSNNPATQSGVFSRFEHEVSSGEDVDATVLDVTVSRAVIPLQRHRFEKRTTERVYIVYALHDISVQKRAEQRERAAKEAHAEASTAKSQLISNMSHELRTPLNAIVGFSSMLSQQVHGALGAPEYEEYAGLIHRSGKNLSFVLNDIIQSSQLQSDDFELSTDALEIDDLIDAAVEEAKQRPYWHDAIVDQSRPTRAILNQADFGYLKLALAHLVHNSAKFGGPNAKIAIETDIEGENVIIRVSDEGPGCNPNHLPKLKTMFFQSDGTFARQYEGCGLGLYIANQIIERHGGQLDFSSNLDQGFEARVTLPGRKNLQSDKAA